MLYRGVGVGVFSQMLSYFLDVAPHADKIPYKGDVHKFLLNVSSEKTSLVKSGLYLRGIN
jgi:hypothetical protein